jgi:hypothetical protein
MARRDFVRVVDGVGAGMTVSVEDPTPFALGEYTVYRDSERGHVVVCPPERRKRDAHSFTRYWTNPDTGNIEPTDTDVELDPYHMCLLYQFVAQHGGA